MAATALVRLGALTGRDDLTAGGPRRARIGPARAGAAPAAAGQSLIALDFLLAPIREFAVIAGADSQSSMTSWKPSTPAFFHKP